MLTFLLFNSLYTSSAALGNDKSFSITSTFTLQDVSNSNLSSSNLLLFRATNTKSPPVAACTRANSIPIPLDAPVISAVAICLFLIFDEATVKPCHTRFIFQITCIQKKRSQELRHHIQQTKKNTIKYMDFFFNNRQANAKTLHNYYVNN